MALKGEILKAYNNLPAIPIEQPLGDLLNTIPVGDPALENPTGTVTLYVSASGSDDTGDGSQANPFATPQAAIDAIPSTIAKGSRIEIFCGAGSFPFPDTSRVPPSIFVSLIGDISNPVISIPVGSVPFPKIAGKLTRRQGNVGAYTEVISDDSHWMYVDLSALNLGSQGYLVTASSSPNLDMISGSFDPASLGDVSVHAYTTTFVVENLNYFAPSLGDNNKLFEGNVTLVGISVTASNLTPKFDGLCFYGCKFSHSSSFFNPYFKDCLLKADVANNVSPTLLDNTVADAAYFKGSCNIQARFEGFNGVFAASLSFSGNNGGFLGNLDYEGSGTKIRLLSNASVSVLDSSVAATVGTFIDVVTGDCFFEMSGPVTGSVTGNAIVLRRGSQAKGVQAACLGTLTAGGSEIVIGGNAGQAFVSLPANDLGAANPQLCRAE